MIFFFYNLYAVNLPTMTPADTLWVSFITAWVTCSNGCIILYYSFTASFKMVLHCTNTAQYYFNSAK